MTTWRRVVSGLLLVLLVVIAVAAAALAKLPQPPTWAAMVIAGAAFAAGLVLDPFKKRAAEWIERPRQHRTALLAHTRMHDRAGHLLRVRECTDATALGVHPSTIVQDAVLDATRLPPYVRRDAHTELRQAFTVGGLVVIEGASTAGKSRLAFECMHAYVSDRWLIVPDGPAGLKEIIKADASIRNAVIWLDDVQHYLASGGLDGAVLDALCPLGCADVLVLATLRSEARNELTAKDLQTSTARAIEEVMRRARVIHLENALTPSEQARAEHLRTDPRIAAALDQTAGAGFTEYLAAAPAILEHWQSARHGQHPTAAAIISAAVDAHRAGHQTPIPRALLEKLYLHYLDARTRHRPKQPAFDQELDWATQPVKGASACLTPFGQDTYQPFEYLIDHKQRTSNPTEIPAIWSDLLAHATAPDVFSIGIAAYQADQHDISQKAFHRAAEAGDTRAMSNLGVLLAEAGRIEEAEQWYRRAAETGHADAMSSLGVLLAEAGRIEEAEQWYRRAAEAGDTDAMYNLGILLQRAGRIEEAEQWYRRAAEAGAIDAMYNCGVLLAEAGRIEEAEQWYRRAAETGDTDAMSSLGVLLAEAGRI
ncbi:sel1 repeat family protein, partial [Nonomuraea sp. K274]